MRKVICNYPWTHFEVNNPNGDVTMCSEDNNIILGNVRNNSIMEIWNGIEYQNVRRKMYQKGAAHLCPTGCPVLKGLKRHQDLSWYKTLDHQSPVYLNAEKNELEIGKGKAVLESKPRWLRYTYSYVCNLNCYHCYQKSIRRTKQCLPDNFINDIYSFGDIYQVMFHFGGEPFLYDVTNQLLKSNQINQFCRHFFATNATLLNEEHFELLGKKDIGNISCSLDGATKETYEKLRMGGCWSRVMDNLHRIGEMKKTKDFRFSIDMTVNSKNGHELEKFCGLVLSLHAEPRIGLVSNSFYNIAFQKEYLSFSASLMQEINRQIDNSIMKLEEKGYHDAQLSWKQTKKELIHNRNTYQLRLIYNMLPQSIKRIIQSSLREYS